MSRRFICASLLHARMHAVSERRRTPKFIASPSTSVAVQAMKLKKKGSRRVRTRKSSNCLVPRVANRKTKKIVTQAEPAKNIATIVARIAASVAIDADYFIILGCHFRATQWTMSLPYSEPEPPKDGAASLGFAAPLAQSAFAPIHNCETKVT